MFEKKVEIYRKKDKENWKAISDLLKQNGLKVSAGHFFAESLCAGGCGSKLDPRNFGDKGKIDREVYYIRVKEKDEKQALELIAAAGLEAVVDMDATLDAAQRYLKQEETMK